MLRLWMRRVLLGLAGLALLAGATVTWLVASFDAEPYRALAVDWMRNERQRTLTIEGPVRLSVLPRLQVTVGRLQLSERFKPDPFLVLDEAALAVDLVPLLASQLVVHRIDARGVKLTLSRSADGARNFDDLIGAGSGGGALKFELRRLALQDVRATVRDAMLPLRGEVQLQHLDTGRIGVGQRTPVDLALRFALDEPSLKGEIDGGFHLSAAGKDAPLQFSDLVLRYRGDVAGLREVDARLRGAAAVDLDHDRIEAEGLAIDFDARGGDWQLAGSTLRAARVGVDMPAGGVAWTDLALELKGRHGADQPFTASLRSPQLGLGEDGVAGQGLSGRIGLEGDTPLAVRFETGVPTGRLDALRVPGLTADVTAGTGARRLEARASTALQWRLAAGSHAFERLGLDRLELKGMFDPGLGGAPWSVGARGSVGLTPDGASWNLTATLAEDACTSDGSAQPVAANRPRPLLTVRARCERLDLGRWREAPGPAEPVVSAGAGSGPAAAGAGASSASAGDTRQAVPLDFGALRGVDARVSLRAGQLRLHPVEARDARLEATLAQGVLKLTSLQARAWDGAIDASGQFDASAATDPPALSLRLAATGVDIGGLLRDLAGAGRIEGRGRFDASVSSTGTDLPAWRRGLRGEAKLLLRDGAVVGLNLPQALRQARSALDGEGRDATERLRPGERTSFTELRASFDIAEGVARNRDLEIKSPMLRIGGEGAFDLRRQHLDVQALASVAATGPRQDGADYAALAGMPVPLQLRGPFDAVDWTIRWRELAGGPQGPALRERLAGELGRRLEPARPVAPGPDVAASTPAATTASAPAAASTPR